MFATQALFLLGTLAAGTFWCRDNIAGGDFVFALTEGGVGNKLFKSPDLGMELLLFCFEIFAAGARLGSFFWGRNALFSHDASRVRPSVRLIVGGETFSFGLSG